jgi:hypothetical protein
MPRRTTLATIAGWAFCESLVAAICDAPSKDDTQNGPPTWSFSLDTLTYLAQHARDYANPNFLADYGWLHLEARYNYERFRLGLVVESTQASSDSDVRPGPLVGFKCKDKDRALTFYWLSPGSREATFVFGVNFEF